MTIRPWLSLVPLALFGLGQAHAASITVQSGDTLSELARTHLGSDTRWPELCKANQDTLHGDCDALSVGAILVLPGTAEEMQQAPTPEVQASAPVVTPPEPASVTQPEPQTAAQPEPSSENLLQSADDLADTSKWQAIHGITVSSPEAGVFELATSGVADPILLQEVATKTAGATFRLTGEAKAGNTEGATAIMRVFGYAVAEDGSPAGATITTGDEPLGEQFSPFEIVVTVPEDFVGKDAFVFRLDPGDGNPNGSNTPPTGYSIQVRNLSLVEVN